MVARCPGGLAFRCTFSPVIRFPLSGLRPLGLTGAPRSLLPRVASALFTSVSDHPWSPVSTSADLASPTTDSCSLWISCETLDAHELSPHCAFDALRRSPARVARGSSARSFRVARTRVRANRLRRCIALELPRWAFLSAAMTCGDCRAGGRAPFVARHSSLRGGDLADRVARAEETSPRRPREGTARSCFEAPSSVGTAPGCAENLARTVKWMRECFRASPEGAREHGCPMIRRRSRAD